MYLLPISSLLFVQSWIVLLFILLSLNRFCFVFCFSFNRLSVFFCLLSLPFASVCYLKKNRSIKVIYPSVIFFLMFFLFACPYHKSIKKRKVSVILNTDHFYRENRREMYVKPRSMSLQAYIANKCKERNIRWKNYFIGMSNFWEYTGRKVLLIHFYGITVPTGSKQFIVFFWISGSCEIASKVNNV